MSELDFLYQRLQTEIDELTERMEALFNNVNKLKESNDE
jgi:FtsZ-binding cell division protein ZapB